MSLLPNPNEFSEPLTEALPLAHDSLRYRQLVWRVASELPTAPLIDGGIPDWQIVVTFDPTSEVATESAVNEIVQAVTSKGVNSYVALPLPQHAENAVRANGVLFVRAFDVRKRRMCSWLSVSGMGA